MRILFFVIAIIIIAFFVAVAVVENRIRNRQFREVKDRPGTAFQGYVVGALGLVVILMAAVPTYRNNANMRSWEPVTGVVSFGLSSRGSARGVAINRRIYVSYTVDGRNFPNRPLREYRRGMYSGMEIQLFYNPENPRNVTTGGRVSGFFVLLIAGGVFVCIGIAMVIKAERREVNVNE